MILNFKRVRPDAKMWAYAHPEDACMDVYSASDFTLTVSPKKVPTGIAVSVPRGWMGLILPRSGLSFKGVISEKGIIDPGYTGEVCANIHALNQEVLSALVLSPDLPSGFYVCDGIITVLKGARIAQFCLVPCPSLDPIEVDELPKIGSRGNNGFGSTGYTEI